MTLQAPMTCFRFVVLAKSLDGLIDDSSWHLTYNSNGPPVAAADLDGILTQFVTKLTTAQTGMSVALGAYYSKVISRAANACSIDVYDFGPHLDGSPMGSPIRTKLWTCPTVLTGPIAYPESVAVSLGYASDYGTDPEFAPGPSKARPRATHRNRFYFGPIAGTLISDTTTFRCKVAPAMITDFLSWMSAAFTLNSGSGVVNLVQWSLKEARVLPAVTAWMDDRADTIRKRADPNPIRTSRIIP